VNQILCFQANHENIHFDNENFHPGREKFRIESGMKGSIQRRKGFDFDAKTCFVLETMAINFNNHEHIPSQLETSPILKNRRNKPETCSPPIEAWISVAKSRTVDRTSETPV
jgi:hypothetical protein